LTDLSRNAKKSTANGDTRSGLRLRLRIAAPGPTADLELVETGEYPTRRARHDIRVYARPPFAVMILD
jgi:hypothetical protein